MVVKNKFIALMISLIASGQVYAIDVVDVRNERGETVFSVRFYDVGDGAYIRSKPDGSTWNLTEEEKNSIINGIKYWADILDNSKSASPIIINVGTVDDNNAYASSPYADLGAAGGGTLAQAMFMGVSVDDSMLNRGSHAQIMIGYKGSDNSQTSFSPLPGSSTLSGTTIHELTHALGMMGRIPNLNASTPGSLPNPRISSEWFNTWTAGFRDDNDNPARAGQTIWCDGCENPDAADVFDLRNDQGYFTGEHVAEVLDGGMKGIPIRMHYAPGQVNPSILSHAELRNSMLSHQSYRNYTALMEAELAMMQDLGYQIDRRNYYGYSVYGDNQVIQNNNGYFARNAAKTAYIPGEFNTATLGTGLHIYGSNNEIRQTADLLTAGEGGVGVRIDGSGNTLFIPEQTRIVAEGVNGNALLVAYGKDNRIVHRGSLIAGNMSDAAARFDFGANALGADWEQRGSWIRTTGDTAQPLLDELKGAAVASFDVSGILSGKKQAIYASWNSLVGQINILRGARISGDIISDYVQQDENGDIRTTTLSFGKLMNADGSASDAADAGFSITYDGDIRSQQAVSNIVLSLVGGKTVLNGNHFLNRAEVNSGAVLGGNGTYAFSDKAQFVNYGVVAPGDGLGSMTINGAYTQGGTGALWLETQADNHDVLTVNGDASLAGTLKLSVEKDYYANDWRRLASEMVKISGDVSGAFSQIETEIASPTLSLSWSEADGGDTAFYISRSYERYAANGNSRAVGDALVRMTDASPSAAMRSLVTALDFSAAGGADVRDTLPKLTSEAYSAGVAGTLQREHQLSEMLQLVSRALPAGERRSFAAPFGGGFRQDSAGSAVGYRASGYGLLAGMEKGSEFLRGWTLGLHGAISGQKVDAKAPYDATAKASAADAGLHARYEDDEMAGLWAFSQIRFGVENARMDRKISVGDYSGRARGKWTGMNGGVGGSGGYRFQLSESFSAGPLASLEYTRIHTPSVTESGDAALRVGSADFNSLRSVLGVQGDYLMHFTDGTALKASVQAGWEKELMDYGVSRQASFAGYDNTGFRTNNSLGDRDALKLSLAAEYRLANNVDIGTQVASSLLRENASLLEGTVYLRWLF